MDNYHHEIEDWRWQLDANLRTESSWLALAGLYWLEAGENTIGTDPANQIVLPPGSGPGHIGSFLVENGRVRLQVADDLPVLTADEIVKQIDLEPDISGDPTRCSLENLVFILIQREESLGIRVWDNNRPQRQSFPGRQWFPIQDVYRIQAEYLQFESKKPLTLKQRNSPDHQELAAGEVLFEIAGRPCSLVVFEQPEGELFLIFHDLTNGSQTYSGGRYLSTPPVQEGIVEIDFNRAYNPPCAFTDHATCTLPPAQNRLEVKIPAGELKPLLEK